MSRVLAAKRLMGSKTCGISKSTLKYSEEDSEVASSMLTRCFSASKVSKVAPSETMDSQRDFA